MVSDGTWPENVIVMMSRSCSIAAASAIPGWLPSAAAPSIISVSGVTPIANAAPSVESRIAAAKRSTEARTVGCSGG